MLLGTFGAHNFYLSKPIRAVVDIVVTIALVCAIGFPVFFLLWQNVLAFLLPFLAVWIYHVLEGIYILRVQCPKDGNGEFLR